MKGQLVFEFIIAALVFMGIVIFILNTITTNVSQYSQGYADYSLQHKVIAASEALVRQRQGIGIASNWPIFNSTRIAEVQTNCSDPANYVSLLTDLNLVEKSSFGSYDVRIVLNNSWTGVTLLDCHPPTPPFLPTNVTTGHISRYGLLDTDEPVQLYLWVW